MQATLSPKENGPAAGTLKRSKRIAHVTFGLDVGGLEKLIVQFAAVGLRDGHHVEVINLGHVGPIANELTSLGVSIRSLGVPSGFRPDLWFRLWRLFRKGKFDVVHTHDVRPMIYAGPAAKWASVPVRVHTQHGRELFTGGRVGRLVLHASGCMTDVVAVSADIESDISNAKWTPGRLVTIRNGIDSRRYQNSPPNHSNTTRDRVVCIARLSPEKGIDTLIEAFHRLKRSGQTLSVEIAGEGPSRSSLENQIDSLGLKQQVKLLGNVSDIPGLLEKARVFVLPSRSEGISLTLLEAQFAGVPIVATSVGGTPEVIQDGVNGRLVPAEATGPMADAIEELWQNESLRSQFVAAGLQIAEQQFGVDQMMEQYEWIYQSQLSVNDHEKGS